MKAPWLLLVAAGCAPALGAAQEAGTAHQAGDDVFYSYTLIDRLEAAAPATDHAALQWEAGGWIGGDVDRLWWRSEGTHADGGTADANLEVLFGRSFSPRWDWVAGVRQDFRPRTERTFVALGLRGLAPQWFDVAATAYLGEGGRTAAWISVAGSLLFTNRLVLQPQAEVNLYGRQDASRGIGSGLSTVEAGLRLRYEFTRQFAPYLGVGWDRAFAGTARLRRAAQQANGATRVLAGVRIWF